MWELQGTFHSETWDVDCCIHRRYEMVATLFRAQPAVPRAYAAAWQ